MSTGTPWEAPERHLRTLRDWIYLGSSLRYLLSCDAGWRVHGDAFLMGNLEAVLVSVHAFALPRARAAAEDLQRFRDRMRGTSPDYRLSKDEATALRRFSGALKAELRADIDGRLSLTIPVPVPETSHWLKDLDAALGSVGPMVSPAVRRELEEATRALALGLPAAAASMMLQATGVALAEFYVTWTGASLPEGLAWWQLVEELRMRPPPPPEDLLRALEYLAVEAAGVMTPSRPRYDHARAVELLDLVRGAVARMEEAAQHA